MTARFAAAAALLLLLQVAGSRAAAANPATAAEPGAAAPAPNAQARDRPPVGHAETTYTYGVGAFVPDYESPEPGSYELPPMGAVGDHALVGADGRPTRLFDVLGDRLAVVSFIYASCAEATGCPMATAVLHHLDRTLSGRTGAGGDTALLTISFDPERDTPEKLAEMEGRRAAGSAWRFVTSPDDASLEALLGDFGQSVSRLLYADGTWTGTFRHVLKVYLLDRERRIRNVYSVGLLHPELVGNDLETLRLEEKR